MAVQPHPVRLILADDLERNRLTTFFRLLLVIPHVVWLITWGLGAFLAALGTWVATLVRGAAPGALHSFLASYVKYVTHVYAYLFLVADPYPRFDGRPGYPLDISIDAPRPQRRWTVAVRIVLAVPALALASSLTGGFSVGARGGAFKASFGLLYTVGFLAWFAILARAAISRGLRDAAAYALAYSAQLWSYLFLLTDRYPDSDPLLAVPEIPQREHPVSLQLEDDLQRSRITVFFRLLLAPPHLVWLVLWGLVAVPAVIANWLATLIGGRPSAALHSFLSRYLRYVVHVDAYLNLTANPFPGFAGAADSYPIEARLPPPGPQSRARVFFRLLLAIPALLMAAAYGSLLSTAALLGWFAALATGRMPRGLRNAQALALRYGAQAGAYAYLLLTETYPYAGPCTTAAGSAEMPAAPGGPATPAGA
jgi:Domain of unknown function (DUF4389)